MLSWARGALTVLTFGSIAALALSGAAGCAVNQSGLSLSGGGGTSAAGGSKGGATGTAGASGGRGGIVGTAGTFGTAGTTGTAGTFGTAGGADGSAGTLGGAGATGAGATGGTAATGGGGAAGTDGQAGTNGNGGSGPTVGTGGAGGRPRGGAGGSGHTPDCSSFPSGSSTTLLSDGLLHCYWTHSDAQLWTGAESTCQGEGGTLATILSAQENIFAVALGVQNQLFQGAAVVWLGASDGKASNDMSGPGTYAWVTGEPFGPYHPWQPGEPEGSCTGCNGNENEIDTCFCEHFLAFTSDGSWVDRSESVTRPYICEATAR